jgi:hypothetical protein
MILRIEIHSVDHSYSVVKEIDNPTEITVPFIREIIEGCVSNDYDFDDEEQEAIDKYPVIPKGYFDDKSELWEDVYETAISALPSIVAPFEIEYYLDGRIFEPEIELDINQVVRSIIAEHLEDRRNDNQSDVDIGIIILKSLELFYSKGQWNEGFVRDDGAIITQKEKWPKHQINKEGQSQWRDCTHCYTPIIWFGMKDEAPIQYWTLGGLLNQKETDAESDWTEDSWKDMWFDFDGRWNYLLDYDDAIYTWLFWELCEEEPDIDTIIETCPVELLESDTTKGLYDKIEEHFKTIKR